MAELTCIMCDEEATVLDTENNDGYCDEHADEYEVFDGPHRLIGEPEDIEIVPTSGEPYWQGKRRD